MFVCMYVYTESIRATALTPNFMDFHNSSMWRGMVTCMAKHRTARVCCRLAHASYYTNTFFSFFSMGANFVDFFAGMKKKKCFDL